MTEQQALAAQMAGGQGNPEEQRKRMVDAMNAGQVRVRRGNAAEVRRQDYEAALAAGQPGR